MLRLAIKKLLMQHWCDAIAELVKLIPDYKTDNPEFISELEYVETNQKLLNLK